MKSSAKFSENSIFPSGEDFRICCLCHTNMGEDEEEILVCKVIKKEIKSEFKDENHMDVEENDTNIPNKRNQIETENLDASKKVENTESTDKAEKTEKTDKITSYSDDTCGRLLPLPDGSHVHVNCLRWSSEVVERGGRLMNGMQAKAK